MHTARLVGFVLTSLASSLLHSSAPGEEAPPRHSNTVPGWRTVECRPPSQAPPDGLHATTDGGFSYRGRYCAELPGRLGGGGAVRLSSGPASRSPWLTWAPAEGTSWELPGGGLLPGEPLRVVEGIREGAMVRFPGAYGDGAVDVVYKFETSRLKEDLIIRGPVAVPEGAVHLLFPLDLRLCAGLGVVVDGGAAPGTFETGGALEFHRGGRMVLQFFAPVARDARGDLMKLRWRGEVSGGRGSLALLIPAAWLAKATYPVTIDPSGGTGDPPFGRLRFLRDQELGYLAYDGSWKQHWWWYVDAAAPGYTGHHDTPAAPEVDGYLDATCGDFNNDGHDEVVILEKATADQGTFASIWDIENSTQYTVKVVEHGATALRITAGDADNDGRDDVFVLWEKKSDDGGVARVVTLIHTLEGFEFERSDLHSYGGTGVVDLAAADLDGDLDAEVVVLWELGGGDYNAMVWVIDPSGHFPVSILTHHSCRSFQTVKKGPAGLIDWDTRTHKVHPVAIAAADLDQDRQDEVIVLNDYWDELKDKLDDDAGWGYHWQRKGDHSNNLEVFDPYATDPASAIATGRWEETNLQDLVAGDYWRDNHLRAFAVDSDGEVHYSKPFDPAKPAMAREDSVTILSGATRLTLGDIDGDSLAGIFSACYTHEENNVLAAYLELPPCHKGINASGTSAALSLETASGSGLGSHVELTTRMSVGLEAEAEFKIFEVGASSKYTLSAAVGRADSEMVERRLARGMTVSGDPDVNPDYDDGVLVFHETFNVYCYDVLNPGTNDPAYFTIITPSTLSYQALTRETYETAKQTSLGLKNSRIGGRVATAAQTEPGSKLLSTGSTFAQAGDFEVDASLALSTNTVSETDVTVGFGYESEVKAGALGISVTRGLGVDLEWGATFTSSLTRATSFDVAIGGLSKAHTTGGTYQVGTYVRKETASSGHPYFHLGFWVPTSSWGGDFLTGPALGNFSRTPSAEDVPDTVESLQIEVEATDDIGVDRVKYRIVRESDGVVEVDWTSMKPSPGDPDLYTAAARVNKLSKNTHLVVEIQAEDNNYNTSTLKDPALHAGGSRTFQVVDPASEPPVPLISGTYTGKDEGDEISFSGSSTGTGVTLTWDFGDGSAAATGSTPKHTYRKTGTYRVTLTAVDGSGKTGQTTLDIDIGNTAPTVTLTLGTNPARAGQEVRMEGAFSDPGTAGSFAVTWDFGDGTTRTGRWIKDTTPGNYKVLPEVRGYATAEDKQFTVKLKVEDGTTNTTASAVLTVKKNTAPATPSLADGDVPKLGAAYDLDLDLDVDGKAVVKATWQVRDADGDKVSSRVYLARGQSGNLERSNLQVADADLTDQQAELPITGEGTWYWMVVASDPYGGAARSPVWWFTVDHTGPSWVAGAGAGQAVIEKGALIVAFDRARDPSGVRYNLYLGTAPLTFGPAERTPAVATTTVDGPWPLRHVLPGPLPAGMVHYVGVRAEDETVAYPGFGYAGGSRTPNEESNGVTRMVYETPGTGVIWTLARLSAAALDRLGNPIVIAEGGGVYTSRGSLTIAAADTLLIGAGETLRFDDTTGAAVLNVLGTLKSADHGVPACPRVLVVGFPEEQGSFIEGAWGLAAALRATDAEVTESTGLPAVDVLDAFDAVFVALGCTPANHALTPEEIGVLDQYLVNGKGGAALYVEGGAVWSQPEAQPLRDRFGVRLEPGSDSYFGGMEGTGVAAGLLYPGPWAGEVGLDAWISPGETASVLVQNVFPATAILVRNTATGTDWRTVASVAEFGGLAANPQGPGGLPLMRVILGQVLVPGAGAPCAAQGPKTITSKAGQPGGWHGITAGFLGAGGSVRLKLTTVENARTGVAVIGGSLDLDSCTVRRCTVRGVLADHAVQVRIMDSLLADNSGEGFVGAGLAGAIGRTAIRGNGGSGLDYSLHLSQAAGVPLFVVHNCTVSGNGADGVNLGWVDANVQLLNNQVQDNVGAGIRMSLEGLAPVGAGPMILGNTVLTNREGVHIEGVHPVLRANTITGNRGHGVYVANALPDLGRMPAQNPQPGANTIHSNGSGYDAWNATPANLVMAEGNTWNANPALPPVASQFYPGPLNAGFDYCPFAAGNCAGGGVPTPVVLSVTQSTGGLDLSWAPVAGNPIPLGGYRAHYGTASGNYPFTLDAGDTTTARITNIAHGATCYLSVSAVDTSTGARFLPSAEISHTLRYRADLGLVLTEAPDLVVPPWPAVVEFVVTNRGPEPALDAVVSCLLPDGVALTHFASLAGRPWSSESGLGLAFDVIAPGVGHVLTFHLLPTDLTPEAMEARFELTAASVDGTPDDTVVELSIPIRKDTDGDGMPDDWERANDLNPGDATDAAKDSDEDGLKNGEEYLAGTLPWDPESVLAILSVESGPEDVRLTFASVPGKRYQIERSGTVLPGSWSPATGTLEADGAKTTASLASPPTTGDVYYRVRLVP